MLPLTALIQRRNRLLVAVMLLTVVVVGLAVVLVIATLRRPVAWGVDGTRLTAIGQSVAITAPIVEEHARRVVGTLETWGYPGVAAIPGDHADLLHPALLPEMTTAYEQLAEEAKRGRLYRAAIPTTAKVLVHTQDHWEVVVLYRETTWYGAGGKIENSDIQPSTGVFKVAHLYLVQVAPTESNPMGLRLTKRLANLTPKEYYDERMRSPGLPDLLGRDFAEIGQVEGDLAAQKARDDAAAAKAAKRKRSRPAEGAAQ